MLVLPSGSQSVDLNRTYTGLTRHRASVQLVLSEDHERDLVRRQIGDRTPVTPSEAMERTARNLAREDERELASDLQAYRRRGYAHGTLTPPLPYQRLSLGRRFATGAELPAARRDVPATPS